MSDFLHIAHTDRFSTACSNKLPKLYNLDKSTATCFPGAVLLGEHKEDIVLEGTRIFDLQDAQPNGGCVVDEDCVVAHVGSNPLFMTRMMQLLIIGALDSVSDIDTLCVMLMAFPHKITKVAAATTTSPSSCPHCHMVGVTHVVKLAGKGTICIPCYLKKHSRAVCTFDMDEVKHTLIVPAKDVAALELIIQTPTLHSILIACARRMLMASTAQKLLVIMDGIPTHHSRELWSRVIHMIVTALTAMGLVVCETTKQCEFVSTMNNNASLKKAFAEFSSPIAAVVLASTCVSIEWPGVREVITVNMGTCFTGLSDQNVHLNMLHARVQKNNLDSTSQKTISIKVVLPFISQTGGDKNPMFPEGLKHGRAKKGVVAQDVKTSWREEKHFKPMYPDIAANAAAIKMWGERLLVGAVSKFPCAEIRDIRLWFKSESATVVRVSDGSSSTAGVPEYKLVLDALVQETASAQKSRQSKKPPSKRPVRQQEEVLDVVVVDDKDDDEAPPLKRRRSKRLAPAMVIEDFSDGEDAPRYALHVQHAHY